MAMNTWNGTFEAGFGSVDITPPAGLPMAGSLDPRRNEGAADPLKVKSLYVHDGENALVIAGVDLLWLDRALTDQAAAEASERTGVPVDAILVSCSHTHSGPYTASRPHMKERVRDEGYLRSLPGKITESIVTAFESAQPAVLSLGRSLVYNGLHHRRVIAKHDGMAVNTWMHDVLDDLDAVPQVLGTAGPIDPELWVARFDSLAGTTLGMLVNFSLHANHSELHRWSADYPGVIAGHMAQAYGEQAVSVFTPGACANVNPSYDRDTWREGAGRIALKAVDACRRAKKIEGPIRVSAIRKDMLVPRRNPYSQNEEVIERSWPGRKEHFLSRIEHMAQAPEQLSAPVSAARLGPLGIATNPGELFVEWGLEIKRRSPFPHTIVSELTNDRIGYQPDDAAFEKAGYETLAGVNRVAPEGIRLLADTAVELLNLLWDD